MKRAPASRRRSRQLPLFARESEIVVDLFAGGGGASVGIEAALGRPVDVAVNHDPVALAVHCRNHPQTRHMVSDVWEVDPIEATGGRPVGLLWASPDCKDFSVAKGGKPRNKKIRSLAWVVIRWAKAVRPTRIMLENVCEFQGWGPLDETGHRIKSRVGETFRKWKRALEKLGYVVEHRVLDASHYGAPTRRRRFFLVARCDDQPIVWPEPTHGPGRRKVHTAAECIDWTIPCPSIFERKKPLAEKTLWRIAQGIKKFVLENPTPFIVHVNHGKREARVESLHEPLSTVTATQRGHAIVVPSIVGVGGRSGQSHPTGADDPVGTITAKNDRALLLPTLIQTGYGERKGQTPRAPGLDKPLGTIVGEGQKHALVSAFIARHFGDPNRTDGGGGVVLGDELERPLATVTTRDHHSLAAVALAKFNGNEANGHPGCASVEDPFPTITAGGDRGGGHIAEVRAFLCAYYSRDAGQALDKPARTITSKHHLGIVTVHGVDYQIVDIGLRMVDWPELLRAQYGRFAQGYDLSDALTKAAKVRMIGNSVPPEPVVPLVRANYPTDAVRAA